MTTSLASAPRGPEPVPPAPRCGQCHEPLPPTAPRLTGPGPRALCADCALDGLPHTD